ncbi:MAG: hypothetical protein LPK45_09900, partial [Bacteroidota bacterium]|nr:hypothetical protein [Bacteroidota bacterium]MDX5431405.1 hypothetical protein [Bacteroidota bacterium]MDX5470133.1 hypothetical protein [Bacteroidota bacterium]
MRKFILNILLILPFIAVAQPAQMEEAPLQLFHHQPVRIAEIPGDNGVLAQVLPVVGQGDLKPEQLQLGSFRESREGFHYQWNFYQDGVLCEGRYVKVFIDRNRVLRQSLSNLRDLDKTFPLAPAAAPGKEALTGWKHIQNVAPVYRMEQGNWNFYWRVSGIRDLAANAEQVYYTADLTEVSTEPFAWQFTGPDSTLWAPVFDPDPLTSAQQEYGGDYSDFNDADSPAINNERVLRPITVKIENNEFILEDSSFYFTELENPVTFAPVRGINDTNFVFNRSEDGFEFVNTFYHLQTWLTRVHALGYPMLPGEQIKVDPHASNGQDVSGFTPAYGGMSLVFGEGGIDDAEDADVIIHELGHALSYAASPNTTSGLMRTSMEEGTCDYFAMSYSRQISNYGWQKTFNWDGNATWQGRTVMTEKFLPGDFSGNKYANAEIWVAAWRQVYDSL